MLIHLNCVTTNKISAKLHSRTGIMVEAVIQKLAYVYGEKLSLCFIR